MRIQAKHKYIKVSPKKLRFVAKSIKALKPVDALSRLQLVQNRSAKMLARAIKSAIDNGVAVHKISADTLTFAEIRIDEGVFLRRMRPGARGMARPYHRRSSHITILLETSKKNVGTKVEKVETEKTQGKLPETPKLPVARTKTSPKPSATEGK